MEKKEEILELKDNILSLLEQRRFHEVRQTLGDLYEADVAQLLEELESAPACQAFRLLPKDMAAEVFSYLEPESQQKLISLLTDAELEKILEDMYVDDTVDMIEELPANVVKRVLKLSSPESRGEINRLCRYEEDTAGSIMTTEMVDLKRGMTVGQAFDHIRKVGTDAETIYTCYVTDEYRKLEGVVSVRQLLLHPYETKVGD